ncbi:helix-turn-helix domain-containing protein [Siminovitchia sediminis]|uniref:Helix-turn-helix domain-containing protein n=1 Tax=Siminovitchia sediminis TaxID=1274353 RepID=A0ABW4KGB5_9BACI
MPSLGARLRDARKRKGYTQTEVCKILQLKNSRLSGYERDYRKPDVNTLTNLADLYEVSTDWLFGRKEEPDLTGDSSFTSLEEQELRNWLRNLVSSDVHDLRKLKKLWDIMKNGKE